MPSIFAASDFPLLLAGVCVVSVLFFAALMLIFKQIIGPINKFMANAIGLVDRDQAYLPNVVEEAEEDGDRSRCPSTALLPYCRVELAQFGSCCLSIQSCMLSLKESLSCLWTVFFNSYLKVEFL